MLVALCLCENNLLGSFGWQLVACMLTIYNPCNCSLRSASSSICRYIALLVGAMISQGAIRMSRRSIASGGVVEVDVVRPQLREYAGHFAEHECLADFHDVRS